MHDARDPEISWPEGPLHPSMTADAVDVWRIELGRNAGDLQRDARLLSTDEEARAGRFRFDTHRHRFIARRAALRRILGRYLHAPPADLHFQTNRHGKPRLESSSPVRFSASHTHDLALVAVAERHELGVDIERLDRAVELQRLARRFFAPAEADVIAGCEGAAAVAAFFACWTRKEAYVKARGVGLSMGLDTFEVAIDPAAPVALLRTDDDPAQRRRWSMFHLEPGAGYCGALTVEGADPSIRRWRFADRPDPVPSEND